MRRVAAGRAPSETPPKTPSKLLRNKTEFCEECSLLPARPGSRTRGYTSSGQTSTAAASSSSFSDLQCVGHIFPQPRSVLGILRACVCVCVRVTEKQFSFVSCSGFKLGLFFSGFFRESFSYALAAFSWQICCNRNKHFIKCIGKSSLSLSLSFPFFPFTFPIPFAFAFVFSTRFTHMCE